MEDRAKTVGFRMTESIDRAIELVSAATGRTKSALVIESVLEYLASHQEEISARGLDVSQLRGEIRRSLNEALTVQAEAA